MRLNFKPLFKRLRTCFLFLQLSFLHFLRNNLCPEGRAEQHTTCCNSTGDVRTPGTARVQQNCKSLGAVRVQAVKVWVLQEGASAVSTPTSWYKLVSNPCQAIAFQSTFIDLNLIHLKPSCPIFIQLRPSSHRAHRFKHPVGTSFVFHSRKTSKHPVFIPFYPVFIPFLSRFVFIPFFVFDFEPPNVDIQKKHHETLW